MKTSNNPTRSRAILALVLCAGGPWGAAMAADGGCFHSADGNYQIGVGRQIPVWNSIQPGEVVREAEAYGDATVLATCLKGVATFEGDFVVPHTNSMVPLTVGNKDSGFGIEIFLRDRSTNQEYPFPHRYTRNYTDIGFVRADDAYAGYRVIRTTGPVVFGQVDPRVIAEQWSYQTNGARTKAFRHMKIYELEFVRPSCSITADTLTQDVDVGRVNVIDFDNAERATPWKEFRFTVAECQEPDGLIASFTFGTPSDADPDARQLFSLPTLRGVALEIGDDRKNTVRPGEVAQFNAVGTGEHFIFNARMKATVGSMTGGEFSRPVAVTVNFM
jgi:type 1 fimbria pilin